MTEIILTEREKQIIDHLCEGKTVEQISHDINVNRYTLDNYIIIIKAKVGRGARLSVHGLVAKCFRLGLVT